MIAKLSSKGQLTLPIKIRKRLRLKTGDRLKFSINEAGKIEMTPIRVSLKDLKGMLPASKQSVSLEEMEQAILEEGGKV